MISTTLNRTGIDDPCLAHFLYALMSAFPILLLPTLLGLVINLGQKSEDGQSIIGSHLRWQRHSMIGFIVMGGIGFSLTPTWLSFVTCLLATLWFCNRIVKGWLNLTDGAAI